MSSTNQMSSTNHMSPNDPKNSQVIIDFQDQNEHSDSESTGDEKINNNIKQNMLKMDSIFSMVKYVVNKFELSPFDEVKYDLYSKLGPDSIPESKDPNECLAKYQEVLSEEFGNDVGIRFREMYEKNQQVIRIPHPYDYLYDEAPFIRMNILFNNCCDSLIKHRADLERERERTKLIQTINDLSRRITALEQHNGIQNYGI